MTCCCEYKDGKIVVACMAHEYWARTVVEETKKTVDELKANAKRWNGIDGRRGRLRTPRT